MSIITTVGEFQVLEMAGGFRVHGSGLSRHALPVYAENTTMPTLTGAIALASCASVNEDRMDADAFRARIMRCILRHGGERAMGFEGITPVVAA